MELQQIVYLSQATDTFQEDRDIDDILQMAQSRNQEAGVTGMLLFKGGVFLQILEGPKDAVKTIFGSIASDFRHHNLTVIAKQSTLDRIFEDWTMGYRKVSEIDLDEIKTILPWDEMIQKTLKGEKIPSTQLLEVFKRFRFKTASPY